MQVEAKLNEIFPLVVISSKLVAGGMWQVAGSRWQVAGRANEIKFAI